MIKLGGLGSPQPSPPGGYEPAVDGCPELCPVAVAFMGVCCIVQFVVD